MRDLQAHLFRRHRGGGEVDIVEVLRLRVLALGLRAVGDESLHEARQRAGEPDEDQGVGDIEDGVGVGDLGGVSAAEALGALQRRRDGRDLAHHRGERGDEEDPQRRADGVEEQVHGGGLQARGACRGPRAWR